MKHPLLIYALLVSGMALLLLAWGPGGASSAYARPLAALTPTAEPPTRTPTPRPPSTPTLPSRPTVPPTGTPGPITTPQPTREPRTERADPAVTKSVSPSEARIGDIVDFTITVTNHGGETADDVVVTDELPNFLDVVDTNTSKGTITTNARTVVTMIGMVAPGEVITIRIRTRVNEQAQPPGGRNSVTLVSSNNSDDPDNNTASVGISIPEPAASPTVSPTAIPGALPGAAVGSPPGSAGSSGPPGPPNLPNTGVGDERPDVSWPLALLGLAAIAVSLSLRGRGSRKL